jgi:hypothetical protein
MPEATTTLKQKALRIFNSVVKRAGSTLKRQVNRSINVLKGSLKSVVGQKVAPVLEKLNDLKSFTKTLTKTYNTTISAAELVMAAVFGTKELAISAIKKAANELKNSKLNTPGLDVDVGTTKKTEILALVDPEIEADNGDVGLHVKFQGAKVKLNSIDELVNVTNIINNKLNSEDVVSTREWVHKISRTHPLVDEEIKGLEYFEEISNETGSTYIMHTPDTQTLALGDWSTALPMPFRRTLQFKIDDKAYVNTNSDYFELNLSMARNISTEFFYEREETALKDQGNNYLSKELLSNDYHIAGDYTFRENHVGLLVQILMISLISIVGGAGKLINWLAPVNNYGFALSNGVTINVEGNDVVVNLKGDKVGVIATVIDDKAVLEPK